MVGTDPQEVIDVMVKGDKEGSCGVSTWPEKPLKAGGLEKRTRGKKVFCKGMENRKDFFSGLYFE